jgi:hypothetical protein
VSAQHGDLVTEQQNVGFLASASGQGHLEKFRTYYRNLAVWLSPPALIRCMNRRHLWWTVFDSRVVEAVATTSTVSLREADPRLLWGIDKQARDVLGRLTTACQTIRLILDFLPQHIPPRLLEQIDPWLPREPERLEDSEAVAYFDPSPLLHMALGGAIVALHERFTEVGEYEPDELDSVLDDVTALGARVGVDRARETARNAAAAFRALLEPNP